MNAGEVSTAVDDRLEAVGKGVRRKVLHSLLVERRQGGSAVGIGSFSHGPAGEDRVIALGHVHLPKLEDMGFVVVDSEANQVGPGERFDELVPLLEHLEMETKDPATPTTPGQG